MLPDNYPTTCSVLIMLMFQNKKMTTPKFVIFESDPTLIKRSGDYSSFIYNPAGLFYFGPNFDVVPGEPVMIIPYQPDSLGPWKQSRIAFEDGRFFKCKELETLAIMIENRFPNQVFKVTNGSSLAGILNRWGISHELNFVSDRQMEKIEAYELITVDDSDEDDDYNNNNVNDYNNNNNNNNINKPKSKQCCHCR
jgi:hypothetical protein